MIKKLVVKVTIMMVIMVGVGNYAVYLMTGKSPFSTDDIKVPKLGVPKLEVPVLSNLSVPSLPAQKETAYKWTDENGVVHYSTEPPENQQAAVKKLEVDPNQNVIQSVEIAEAKNQQTTAETAQNPTIQSPYSAGAAKKLIEDAKNVQNLLNERYEKQKRIIDSH